MKKETKKVSVYTSLTIISLFTIHVINKIIFFFSTMKEVLYRQNSKFYDWRFGRISYTKKGSGTPILLIHDLSSFGCSYEYKELENHLSKTNTVYTIDLIGCGRSDKPKMTYTNYLYVQLISDFIKQVIKQKTTVVTSRKSCAIAIMACYIDSTLFNELILINPTNLKQLNKFPKRKHKLIELIISTPIIGTFIYNIVNCRHYINTTIKEDYLYSAYPTRKYRDAFNEAAHTKGANSKYIYTSIRCHYTNTNMTHALKDLCIPVHILAGSEVPGIHETVAEYQYYNENIKSTYIQDSKGMPHIECSNLCAQIIKKDV